jgi:endogenous inhibitor of DNA gyrase (YacG/DUF329 family)
MIIHCEYCNIEFEKLDKHIRYNNQAGHKHYCSSKCANLSKKKGKELPCVTCGKLVYVNPSRLKNSKNIFCSKSCSTVARNKKVSGEVHPNYTNGASSYRQDALDYYENKCVICGYDTLEVLQVHHIEAMLI